ncbi:hypothetical protein [uncultured Duncaniella sp.]|uniref:hypothetical protein n=1 Tax=uncultured Duncaniella sp. TaxID=2768039 RepID=UPI0025A9922B|nr:hypothetical protein [uncultured Duncaniella sp.]
MNIDTISRLRALLAAYYAGETSESDERELHRLLGDASLPAEFEADRRMISAMSLFAPSDGFEKRLSDKIDQMATDETGRRNRSGRFNITLLLRVAASLVVAVGVGATLFFHRPQSGSDLTPEEAYLQTEFALAVFADALNKGCDGIRLAEGSADDGVQKALASIGIIVDGSGIVENDKTI